MVVMMALNPNDIVIISNKSANSLWEKVIEQFAIHLESKHREFFDQRNVHTEKFASGEEYIQLQKNIRTKNVHVIGAFHDPSLYHKRRLIAGTSELSLEEKAGIIEENLHTLESDFRQLEKILDAAKGADTMMTYLTYMPDSRQDKKDESRVSISARLTFNDLVGAAGPTLRRFGVIDIHARQLQGYPPMEVDEMSGKSLFLMDLRCRLEDHDSALDDIVLVFPDAGSYKKGRGDIRRLNAKHGIIDKNRYNHTQVEADPYRGDDLKDKYAVIIDDMIDSGGTILYAVKQVLERGAKKVFVYTTHSIFSTKIKRDGSGKAEKIVFTEDKFKAIDPEKIHVVCTDTISRTDQYYDEHKAWLTPYTVAPLLADLMYCNIKGESHGKEIKKYMANAMNTDMEVVRKSLERYKMFDKAVQ